jgi:predicted metal-dependent peptidase
MTFIESPDVPTLGVDDKWRVYCNPDYIRKCADEDTLVGEVIHECLHPTLRHGPRAKIIHATDHAHWNRAGDAELDQRIEEISSVKLVTNRVRPEHFVGGTAKMTAEELYRLPRKTPPKSPRCSGGSGTGGEKQPWEKPGDAPGLTEVQAEIVRAGVAQAVKEHAEKKGRGSVPEGLLRWADQYCDAPPVDWRALVQARVRYAVDSRKGASPSYARPARRNAGGLVLPVHRLPIPRVTIVGDTSASMRDDDVGKILACVWDACEAIGRVSVVSCDAEAHDPVEIRHLDDLKEHLLGGGGTDLRVGIERACESSPDAIVVVTDGETPWPDEEPEVPVTIVLTRESHYSHPPDWAEVIHTY